MIKRSLVVKLWLAIVALVVLVLFLLGLFLAQFFEDFYVSLKFEELTDDGDRIAAMVAAEPETINWEEQLLLISSYIEARIVIIDKAGLIRSCSVFGRGLHRGQKLDIPAVEKILKGEKVYMRGTWPGIEMTVLSVGVPIQIDKEIVGAVFLHSPVEPITQTVKTVERYILFGAAGAILLSTILSFFLTRKISGPILEMNRVALEMAKGNFKEKVRTESDDELGLLGTTMNYLSSELQNGIRELSGEKEQLTNILTSMTDAVITFDTAGNMLLVNPPARVLFKMGSDEVGVNIRELPSPGLLENFETVLREHRHVKDELFMDEKTYKTTMTPLRQDNEDIRGVVAVFHDFTREKRLELLRREFVANVSHELRSPLTLLQGYVEALADGIADNEEERDRYLSILLEETLRLKRLVNDLLDLTQLETGNMHFRTEAVSVKGLTTTVANKFRPLFAEQQKKLLVSVPEGLPLIAGDEDKLQQVLINLLDNAMKYTPQGGTVEVGAEVKGSRVEVYVRDSGPGIPAEELSYIWERFYKVDKARTREVQGGTGLGLAIVKNIIDALGGEVGVISKKGEGAVFFFCLRVFEQRIQDGARNLTP